MLKEKTAIIILMLALTISCQNKENKKVDSKDSNTKEEVNNMEITNDKGELDALLDLKRKASAAKSSDEKKQIYADGIADVKNSGILDSALNVGDKAPNFTLNNALNKFS